MAAETAPPIAERARHLFEHLRAHHAGDRRTADVLKVWHPSRPVVRDVLKASLQFQRGRLMVGCNGSTVATDSNSEPASRWNTRLIVAVAKAAVAEDLCAGATTWLLQVATTELGWQCAIDCDTCYETGVCLQKDCPKCDWNIEACSKNNKFVWPELVGRPAWLAKLILGHLQPGKRVVLDPWDMLYHTPANADVIRIVYDTKTGYVVTPPPHVTSAPEISGPREACFLAPDGVCMGAPPNPPPAEWSGFVDQQVGGVIMHLRRRYPHAVVVGTPRHAIISRDYRHDRIRVRYDPETMRVSHVPTVG